MNRLVQFLRYTQKVFHLRTRLRAVRSDRPWALIPTCAVLVCLLLGVVVRVPSYLNLAQQTQRRRWRRLCGLAQPLSDDTLEYVTERVSIQDLRQQLAGVAQTLKANKALERCKIDGLLFLSLDANEHCQSRSRCCPCCSQRQIEVLVEGQKTQVTEYYHRYVFAQINGPTINVLLDLEPIGPGEEECAAALRLLGRVRRVYGPRFFDAITVDAWYVRGPFLRAVEKLGWDWVVVLKREDMEVYQETMALSRRAAPPVSFEDEARRRQVRLWEVRELHFSDGYAGRPVRAVRSEEQWVQTQIVGGKKRREPRQKQWLWAASAGLDGYGPRTIYQAGHRRWEIENKAFNELTQHYHLDHCYHHEPVSMLVQMLILLLGFTLFTAFAQLHCQGVRLGATTLQALAQELNLALEEDLPWEQWFACG